MKKIKLYFTILSISLLLCGHNTYGQGTTTEIDSAVLVMNNYLDLLNYKAIKPDSTFYIETIIYHRSTPHDTAILKRWFHQPNQMRCELWHGDTLLEGCYSDGKQVFKEYLKGLLTNWTKIAPSGYYDRLRDYDFRGPLSDWQAEGSELTYTGIWKYNGNDVYRIKMETPFRGNRYLLFERESGLLFFIEQTDEHSEYSNHQKTIHPDWHAYHEYQPVGRVLVPSIESYQMQGDVIFFFSKIKYIPYNIEVFTKD